MVEPLIHLSNLVSLFLLLVSNSLSLLLQVLLTVIDGVLFSLNFAPQLIGLLLQFKLFSLVHLELFDHRVNAFFSRLA